MAKIDAIWRFIDKVDIRENDECWEWKAAKKRKMGYGVFRVGVSGIDRKQVYAHRFVWEYVNGPIPVGMYICHKCDNPPCCNPNHLFIGTRADNVKDMVNKGRGRGKIFKGSAHGNSKLSEEQVYAIRAASGSQTKIAKQYGISDVLVCHIKSRKRWGHLP